jgi:hypothetical protein
MRTGVGKVDRVGAEPKRPRGDHRLDLLPLDDARMCAPERGDRPERVGDGAEYGRQPVTLTVEPTGIVRGCPAARPTSEPAAEAHGRRNQPAVRALR